ncbi:hypothetical protein SAY86_003819 [Trapa natans]|uniref:Uncharacterized protein n=1 Tax=Trapa natans TaxID=22666 RepID=A0AAN7RHD4_TRANT|nr:hypothetical protein SAY86_003819 [Trapa natans]
MGMEMASGKSMEYYRELRQGGIVFAHEIPEEGVEMEAALLEYAEMLNAVEDFLGSLPGRILLALDFYQELVEMINVHGAILRVLQEQVPDVMRGLWLPDPESPPKAEAHPEA